MLGRIDSSGQDFYIIGWNARADGQKRTPCWPNGRERRIPPAEIELFNLGWDEAEQGANYAGSVQKFDGIHWAVHSREKFEADKERYRQMGERIRAGVVEREFDAGNIVG